MSKEEALALKNDYEHRLADFESVRDKILSDSEKRFFSTAKSRGFYFVSLAFSSSLSSILSIF